MSDAPCIQTPVERQWLDHLAEFKSQEKPEPVLLLAEDTDLVRLTVAWTNTAAVPAKKLTRPPGEVTTNAWWEWLWANTVFSRQEVMANAAYPESGFDRKFRALVGNRIIYPDGSINSFVQRYLRERVLRIFQTGNQKTIAKKERPS